MEKRRKSGKDIEKIRHKEKSEMIEGVRVKIKEERESRQEKRLYEEHAKNWKKTEKRYTCRRERAGTEKRRRVDLQTKARQRNIIK